MTDSPDRVYITRYQVTLVQDCDMPVERFNEQASPNGPVSQTGITGGSQPVAQSVSATGHPAISQADGTASPRADGSVKSAPLPSSPTAVKAPFTPTAVTSYNDGSV